MQSFPEISPVEQLPQPTNLVLWLEKGMLPEDRRVSFIHDILDDPHDTFCYFRNASQSTPSMFRNKTFIKYSPQFKSQLADGKAADQNLFLPKAIFQFGPILAPPSPIRLFAHHHFEEQ